MGPRISFRHARALRAFFYYRCHTSLTDWTCFFLILKDNDDPLSRALRKPEKECHDDVDPESAETDAIAAKKQFKA